MEIREAAEAEGASEASRGSSVSLEMTPPPPIHENLLLGPAGMQGMDKEDGGMNVLSSPPSGSLCDLGQVTHCLWPEEASGECSRQTAQWGQATRWVYQCAPHLGLGSWWPGWDVSPRKPVIIPAGDLAPY